MLHLRCDFHSEVLQVGTSMVVLLPQPTNSQIGMSGVAREGATPVLYLLHGLSDDATIWTRRTSIERYASELGLAVVMPQVQRSWYSDTATPDGGRYWTFLAEELPALVASSFRVSTRREDTFVAGLSMGGYGAFKLALRHPDRFAAAGSLSGALDVAAIDRAGDRGDLVRSVWGEDGPAGTDADLFDLAARADPSQLPALWATCGTEDHPWLGHQRAFVDLARTRGIDLTADEQPGGHNWGHWDSQVQRFLAWLPLADS